MSTLERCPPSLDLAGRTGRFAAVVPGGGQDVVAGLLAGGNVNHAYEVTDRVTTRILCCPLGRGLAAAHDMAHEYRIKSALSDTTVALPTMRALCLDTVLSGRFYVTERAVGPLYRNAAVVEPPESKCPGPVVIGLADTFATLHRPTWAWCKRVYWPASGCAN